MAGSLLRLLPIFPPKRRFLGGLRSSCSVPAQKTAELFVCGCHLSSEWLSPGQSLYIEASLGCIFGGFYCSNDGFIPARLSQRRQHY